MNLLEKEAERLKQLYGPTYHKVIDQNLKLVSEQMAAMPGSVSVEEGLIVLGTWDLPSLTRRSRSKRPRRALKDGRKRGPKR